MADAEELIKLDTIVVTPTPAENSSNATLIRGKAKWRTCWLHACYLSKYIYKEPPSPTGFHTQFPEKMVQIEDHWETWSELVEQSDSGVVARLFKVKNHDPSSKTSACPPILVYRGTDFEDMRDLAVVATLQLSWAIFSWPFEIVHLLDNTLDPNSTRQTLINAGFVAISIYTDQGTVQAETALEGVKLTVNVALKLEILAKENGDWVNNIRQGLGRESEQYKTQ